MGKRITGKDVDIMVGDIMVHTENFTITIEDGTTVAMTKGVPNGHIDGETKASGEIEVDTANLQLIIAAAKSAGSFKALEPFDIVSNAKTDVEEISLEAFGCKLRISELMNAAGAGGEKLKTKLPFDVTSPDFVRVNGVPYLDNAEIENLI